MRSIVALILMCLHPQDGRRFQAAIPFIFIKYLSLLEILYRIKKPMRSIVVLVLMCLPTKDGRRFSSGNP